MTMVVTPLNWLLLDPSYHFTRVSINTDAQETSCYVDPISAEPLIPISPTLSADSSTPHIAHTHNPWQLASPAHEAAAVSDSGNRVLVTVSAQHDHGLKRSVGKGWTVAVNASRELYQESLPPSGGKVAGRKYLGFPSHAPGHSQPPPLGNRPAKGISPCLLSQYSRQHYRLPAPDENRQPATKRPVEYKVQVGSRNSSVKQQRQRLAPPRKKNISDKHHKPISGSEIR